MSKFLTHVAYLEGSDINPDGSLKPHVCQGKPVVVMVQGNFCGYCTQAKPDFQKFAQTVKNCVAATVQMDGGPEDKAAAAALSKVNTAKGVPAFLGFSSQGKFMGMHTGNRDIAAISAFASTLQ